MLAGRDSSRREGQIALCDNVLAAAFRIDEASSLASLSRCSIRWCPGTEPDNRTAAAVSKLDKARQLGIRVLSEDEFDKLIGVK